MMATNTVSVVLVTYNSAGVIGQALASVLALPQVERCYVVDNASTDSTVALVEGLGDSRITVIANRENYGFGRANNQALEQLTTPYALCLNPDAVMREGALEALIAVMGHYPDAAIVAPQLVDEQGEVHKSYKRHVFAREQRRDHYHPPAGDLCAEFLSGAVWLLRMDAMKHIGFFDPALFMYYEDDDLCIRVRQAGYSNVLVAGAVAVHAQGASSAPDPAILYRKNQYITASRYYLERKYHGEKAARRLRWRQLGYYGLKWLGYALVGKWQKARLYRARVNGVRKSSW